MEFTQAYNRIVNNRRIKGDEVECTHKKISFARGIFVHDKRVMLIREGNQGVRTS